MDQDTPREQSLDSTTTALMGAEETTTERQPIPRTSKLCYYWYHHGICFRNFIDILRKQSISDTSAASDQQDVLAHLQALARPSCNHLHELPSNPDGIQLSEVRRRIHKSPCGLELCQWKDETYESPSKKKKKNKKKKGGKAGEGETSEPSLKTPTGREAENSDDLLDDFMKAAGLQVVVADQANPFFEPKRKRPFHHPDQPSCFSKRSGMVIYDDESESEWPAKRLKQVDETCFFWYHGRCARAKACHFLHELTDPPTMVQPPPGFVHPLPCGLAWCPGDGKQATKGLKSLYGKEKATSPQEGESEVSPQMPDSESQGEATEKEDVAEWLLGGFE